MKTLFIIIGAVVLFDLIFFGMMYIQNGPRKWMGKKPKEILGKDPDIVTITDFENLSKANIMQLFYASDAPEFSKLNGEYKAKMLSVGFLGRFNGPLADHVMGNGHWEGDAFLPDTSDTGKGYNIYTNINNGNTTTSRALKMMTYIGKSEFDNKNSFHVDYKNIAKGLNGFVHDEVRKINDNIYLALVFFSFKGGRFNPLPFVIYDNPTPWIGPDHENV